MEILLEVGSFESFMANKSFAQDTPDSGGSERKLKRE
jgi:hypothetical protein